MKCPLPSACHAPLFVLLLLSQAFPCPGQIPALPGQAAAAPPSTEKAPPPDPKLHLEEVHKQLENLRIEAEKRLASLPPAPLSKPSQPATAATTTAMADEQALALAKLEAKTRSTLEEELKDLETAALVLDQEQAALGRSKSARLEGAKLQEVLAQLRSSGPEEKPPYSFLLVDQVQDALEAVELGQAVEATALDLALAAVESAKEQFETAESESRKLKEEVDALEGGGLQQRLTREIYQRAKIRVLLTRQRLELRSLEREVEKLRAKGRDLRVTTLQEKLDWISARTSFQKQDLETRQTQFTEDLKQMKASLAKTQNRLGGVQRAWMAVQKKLQGQKTPDASLVEQEKARRLELRLLQLQISYLNTWSGWMETRSETWSRRYELATKKDQERQTLSLWEEETRKHLEELDRAHRLATLRLSELRGEFLQLEQNLEENTDGKVNWWTKQSLQLRQRLMRVGDEHLERIEEVRRDLSKLLGELEKRAPSLLQRDWLAEAKAVFLTIWDFELLVAEDRPITVGKILVALVLLLSGFWLARRGSQSFRKLVEERLGVDSGAAASIESIVFYILLLGFTLFALNLAGVPLTAFAFIGGAIAIGLGFGSQNLINNFISGVLLLMERPIQVGDLIVIEETRGRVTRIGARCTTVHTLAGADILIPNSSFLESNVVNLTLGDRKVRVDLSVGVTYGSDPDKVRTVLLEAAGTQPEILETPPPKVLFMDFGASSLDFQLRVWVRIKANTSLDGIRSALRFEIDRRFAEAGLEMPFPQRDVHLDIQEALRVVIEKPE
jgi:small-conductance mechanosensitive channel